MDFTNFYARAEQRTRYDAEGRIYCEHRREWCSKCTVDNRDTNDIITEQIRLGRKLTKEEDTALLEASMLRSNKNMEDMIAVVRLRTPRLAPMVIQSTSWGTEIIPPHLLHNELIDFVTEGKHVAPHSVQLYEYVCSGCGKAGDSVSKGGVMLLCSRCKEAAYCSKECQKKDWKEGDHKSVCKPPGT